MELTGRLEALYVHLIQVLILRPLGLVQETRSYRKP